jgi:hypothetical protein
MPLLTATAPGLSTLERLRFQDIPDAIIPRTFASAASAMWRLVASTCHRNKQAGACRSNLATTGPGKLLLQPIEVRGSSQEHGDDQEADD